MESRKREKRITKKTAEKIAGLHLLKKTRVKWAEAKKSVSVAGKAKKKTGGKKIGEERLWEKKDTGRVPKFIWGGGEGGRGGIPS